MYQMRLVRYSGATLVGPIAGVTDIKAAFPYNDLSSLEFTVNPLAAGADSRAQVLNWLDSADVAVEVSRNGEPWQEAPNGRFTVSTDDSDAFDPAGYIKVTGQPMAYHLGGVVSLRPSLFAKTGKRSYKNANPAMIMRTYLEEAQADGLIPLLSWSFSDGADSAGQAWPTVIPAIDVEPQVTALQMQQNLAEQGLVDWHFMGRELRMYRPGGLISEQRTARLTFGVELGDGPDRRSREGGVNLIRVIGDKGYSLTRGRATSRPHGPRAAVQAQSGVTRDATAILLADAALDKGAVVRGELSRELIMTDRTMAFPFTNYIPGNFVHASSGSAGNMEMFRVAQITLTTGDGDDGLVGGNLLLGDRLLEAQVKTARKVGGILGGGTLPGGALTIPTPPEQERSVPARVQGQFAFEWAPEYIGTIVRMIATISWQPVTEATTGDPLVPDTYVIEYRTAWTTRWSTWPPSSSPITVVRNLEPGRQLEVRIRAMRDGIAGAWSDIQAITVERDETPPPIPSQPSLKSDLGVVTVIWDHRTSSGSSSWPKDLAGIRVYASLDGAVRAQVGEVTPNNPSLVMASWAIGDTVIVDFASYDSAGNESAPGPAAAIQVKSVLEDTELAGQLSGLQSDLAGLEVDLSDASRLTGGVLAGALIEAGSVTATKIADNSISTPKLVAGSVVTAKLAAGAVVADRIAANAVVADKIATGAVVADKIAAGAVTANKLFVDSAFANTIAASMASFNTVYAGKITAGMLKADALDFKSATGLTLTSPVIRTSATANRGIRLDTTAIQGWDANGQKVLHLSATGVGSNKVIGRFQTSLDNEPGIIMSNSSTQGEPAIWISSNGTTGGDQAAIYSFSNGQLIVRGKDYTLGDESAVIIAPGARTSGLELMRQYIDPTDRYTTQRGLFTGGPGVTDTAGSETYGCVGSMALGTITSAASRGLNTGELTCEYLSSVSGKSTPQFKGGANTTAAANVRMDANNTLLKTSSARRFKLDIQDAESEVQASALLDVPARVWFDRAQVEGHRLFLADNGLIDEVSGQWDQYEAEPHLVPGVVAEEVESAGLGLYVTYTPEGEVEGVMYDRLWTLLIPIVRGLRDRVADLESQISQLSADPGASLENA